MSRNNEWTIKEVKGGYILESYLHHDNEDGSPAYENTTEVFNNFNKVIKKLRESTGAKPEKNEDK